MLVGFEQFVGSYYALRKLCGEKILAMRQGVKESMMVTIGYLIIRCRA